ncbi:WD repeat-containing 24 [Gossypium australe]|uniref:WD repeat-containing 24 n=1 Tax=Gossypium australe TaxID=47621 RepID=A0A5B6VMV5_9ROSI|nr:WD repeat-containing 24 [Gossypium australe]
MSIDPIETKLGEGLPSNVIDDNESNIIVMSGFPQSSAFSQNSRGTKRKWVPEEDIALVACMVDLYNVETYNADTGFKSHKAVGQFRHRSFPYYDQLASIYAKDRSTGKVAQTTAYIVEKIDAKVIATVNNLEEGNNYGGCEDDVSLDEMDVSATQS